MTSSPEATPDDPFAPPTRSNESGPLDTWVRAYYDGGWSLLVLAPCAKGPPPAGLTGVDGVDETAQQVLARLQPASNLGIRLPDTVIGIDVDDYDEKTGGITLEWLEHGPPGEPAAAIGELPPTWWVTARSNGLSGVRLFRVPAGMRWAGTAGQDIEIISRGFRYVVCPPSVHPKTTTRYDWIDAVGRRGVSAPRVEELPELPAAWIEHCRKNGRATALYRAPALDDRALLDRLLGFPSGPACSCVQREAEVILKAARRELGPAHNALLAPILRLVEAGVGDCCGAGEVLQEAMTDYSALDPEEHPADFREMVRGAFRSVDATGPGICLDRYLADPGIALWLLEREPAQGERHLPSQPGSFPDPPGPRPVFDESTQNRIRHGERVLRRTTVPWLIQDLIHEAGIGQIIGPPYQGKTLLALHLALTVANGLPDWFGHPVARSGRVLYVAMEGGPGFQAQIRAWLSVHPGTSLDNFYLLDEAELNIADKDSIALLEREMAELELAPVLLIIDTQIEVMPHVEENSNTAVVGLLKLLRRWSVTRGCMTLLVHHIGHDKGGRARGASGQLGAVEVALEVNNPNIKFSKIKYATLPPQLAFAIEPQPGTSGVAVIPLEGMPALMAKASASKRAGEPRVDLKEAITTSIAQHGTNGMLRSDLERAVVANNQDFQYALKSLRETGEVINRADTGRGSPMRFWLRADAPTDQRRDEPF